MDNFLKELYYGNINPQDRCYREDSACQRNAALLSQQQEQLLARLGQEDRSLFESFCNTYAELSGSCELDAFILGFRLGAQMSLDTFCSKDAPLQEL